MRDGETRLTGSSRGSCVDIREGGRRFSAVTGMVLGVLLLRAIDMGEAQARAGEGHGGGGARGLYGIPRMRDWMAAQRCGKCAQW